MARITETVSTINSLIRTVLAVVILSGVGYAGWLAYDAYQQDNTELQAKVALLSEQEGTIQELNGALAERTSQLDEKEARIRSLNEELEADRRRIDQLQTALHLLKVDHRLARITVLKQETDEETGQLFSSIEFLELNDEGAPMDEPRVFRIEGNVVYVDYWVVKFDEKYVENSDVHRSTSICLFRRIFGESQEPRDGYVLDQVGSRPNAYSRGGKPSEFEKAIWDDFWNIANDPQKAHDMGIRAAHGEAIAILLRPGKKYRVMLRASGGLSITPIAETPARRASE